MSGIDRVTVTWLAEEEELALGARKTPWTVEEGY